MTLVELGYARGKFSDVAADPLGWCVVLQDEATGHLVFCQLDADGERRVPDVPIAAFGGNAFPVLCVWAGATWLAFRDGVTGHGVLMNLTGSLTCDLGLVHGNSPIAFGAGFCAYQATSAYAVQARLLSMPDSAIVGSHVGRPTGLAGNTADGPILVDDVRALVPGMANPQRAGRCVVGENADAGPNRNIARLTDGREAVLWPGLDSFTPRIATDGGTFAVVTWGSGRTRLALLTDQDFRPPVVVVPPPPPPPDPRRWDLVPDGEMVTDAIRTLVGANPVRQGDIICLHKNTFPECEWRKVVYGQPTSLLLHWADASRFPGDRGWWIEPAPIWCLDTFDSGLAVYSEHGTLVDFHAGDTIRWRQTNTLYGIQGGGVLVQFDPRFPNQYTDMSKQGTPQWAPAGYEKQWTRNDGWSKWQYIVTPLTAKGVVPWGDASHDIVIQEVESAPGPPSAPLPFVPCPRPLTPPVENPPVSTKTHDLADIDRVLADDVPEDLFLGAMKRYRDEVCLERDRVGPPDDDKMTGGAMLFFSRGFNRERNRARFRGLSQLDSAVAGFLGAAADYRRAVGIVEQTKPAGPFAGPISTSGRDFVTP